MRYSPSSPPQALYWSIVRNAGLVPFVLVSGTNPEPSESARYSLPPPPVTVSGRTLIVALFLMTVLVTLASDGMGPLRTATPTATAQRYVVAAVAPESSAWSCVCGDTCHTMGAEEITMTLLLLELSEDATPLAGTYTRPKSSAVCDTVRLFCVTVSRGRVFSLSVCLGGPVGTREHPTPKEAT